MAGNVSGKPASTQTPLASLHEQRREAENIRNVFYLVDGLFKREEATIKLILDCLYDVGSINYINQKLAGRPFNRLLKWLVRFPKPIFRIVALRWVKKNAPELVVRWLHRKVKFVPVRVPASAVVQAQANPALVNQPTPQPTIASVPAVSAPEQPVAQLPAIAQPPVAMQTASAALPAATLVKLDTYQSEIRRLNSQVNVLTTLLVTVTVSLGGAFAWLMWRSEMAPVQSVQPIRPAIARCIEG